MWIYLVVFQQKECGSYTLVKTVWNFFLILAMYLGRDGLIPPNLVRQVSRWQHEKPFGKLMGVKWLIKF